MDRNTILCLAKNAGFSAAQIVETSEICFDPAFRPYCEENLCGHYGTNYACPPDCGTPEAMEQRIRAHRYALVLKTEWTITDYSEPGPILAAKASHNASQTELIRQLRALGHQGFMVGSSGCALCTPCALALGEPCRFPEDRYSCMSAYCIHVQKLAQACGMDYQWKSSTMMLFGMYVFG